MEAVSFTYFPNNELGYN